MKTALFKLKHYPEIVFGCIGLVLGIFSLTITPPFQAPDEQIHFYRAYQISTGQMLGQKQGNISGGFIPKSLVTTVNKSEFERVRFTHGERTSVEQILDLLHIPLDRSQEIFVWFGDAVPYTPLPYLGQATGIAIGKFFDAAPIVLMYLGRLANLCIGVFLIMVAIRLLPTFKWFFALVALMPMPIFLMGSLSPDGLTISLAWLCIALLLHYALDPGAALGRRDKLIIVALFIAMSLVKTAYIPLLGLFVLIAINKFGTKKQYIAFFSFLISACMLMIVLWFVLVKQVYVPSQWHGGNPDEQIRMVLSNPFKLAWLIILDLNTFGSKYIWSIGTLGWLSTPLPVYLINLWFSALLIVALVDSNDTVSIKIEHKIKIFLVLCAVIFAIFGLLYINSTPPGGTGFLVQSRYLLPMYPLVFLLLYNNGIATMLKAQSVVVYEMVFLSIPLFVIFSGVITYTVLIGRYY